MAEIIDLKLNKEMIVALENKPLGFFFECVEAFENAGFDVMIVTSNSNRKGK